MRSICCVAAVLLLVGVCLAEDAKPAGKEPVAIFDGKTFTGWQVLKCEAVVEDSCMLLKAGNGMVQTEKKYKDFILEVDWKALNKEMWDSGIYFRYPEIPAGQPWPKMYQANLRKGLEGNVEQLPEARSKDLTVPGEWNHFKLTVVGTKAELEINGKPAWKADGLKCAEGFIGLQAEIPGGGQFLFKNVKLAELDAK